MTASGSRVDTSDPLISIRGLSHVYETLDGGHVKALQGINLDVMEGEFICLVGPSGCGKSTLLQIVAGLVAPQSGACAIGGERISGPRSDIGTVFQQALLMPWTTTLENVLFPARVQKLNMKAATDRARELIALVGLQGFEDRYPGELSGGMQQRAGIARALVHQPRILLMDEPFGALDALTREKLNLQFQSIWKQTGQTVLFITHSVAEAITLGGRVIVMSDRPGTILEEVEIELARPRPMSVLSQEIAIQAQARIRKLLGVS